MSTTPGSEPAGEPGSDRGVDGAPLALRRLREGNERRRAGNLRAVSYAPPGSRPADGQWPVAAILTCADSRVLPEQVFDLASGTLFTVRNAGNVVNDEVLGSLEFATGDLSLPLILVLGHTHCAAVAAAAQTVRTGEDGGSWRAVSVAKIVPAIVGAPPDADLRCLVWRNATASAQQIQQRSEPIAARVARGQVRIATAVLDLATGAVQWTDPGWS
ncbi:MAG: hypothetical protein KGP10_07295 [Actinomycetales bacterium]|nr:hypothetical protein [Actinomycetales bacterium]